MSQLGEAFIPIRAKMDQLDKDLGAVKSLVTGALKGTALAAAAAVTGAAVATVKFAADSVGAFADFEQGMNEVFTLLPGITQEAMDHMSADVLAFAKQAGVLPEDVIPALYQAISAGVPPENVFDFLATANQAAVGGVTDLTTAIDGITSVVNAYGSDVVDATEASDLMFTAVKLGKTNFEELSQSLFNVIPTAASLGVNFGDITAALAAMTAQGVPTSVATTQLRQLLVELSKEGSGAAKIFKEIAGESFAEFIANGGNVQEALQLMEQYATESDVSISNLFGSVEAGNAALALTGQGTDTFSANLEQMAESAGASAAAFETMDGGINRAKGRAAALWSTVQIGVGNALEPLATKLVELGEKYMPVVEEALERASPVIEAFAEEFGEKLGPALELIFDALNRIVNAFADTNEEVDAMDALIGLLKISLDVIITAVEATAVAFHLLANAIEAVDNFIDGVKEKFQRFGETISGLDDKLPDWLTPGSPTPLEIGLRGLNDAINSLPDLSTRFDINAPALAGAGAGGLGGNTTIVNIDGVSAMSQGGDSADEAIRLTVQLLRQALGRGA